MPSSQSDYILRVIEQIGAALRRMRELLARGVSAAPEVLEQAERSQQELFGPLWPALRTVDSETAAALVPETRQLRMWVELLRLEADAAELAGDPERADQRRRRAAELARALEARGDGG